MGLDAACAQVLGPTGPTFVNVLQQLTHAMVAASTAAAIASGGAGCDVEWLTECTDMLVEVRTNRASVSDVNQRGHLVDICESNLVRILVLQVSTVVFLLHYANAGNNQRNIQRPNDMREHICVCGRVGVGVLGAMRSNLMVFADVSKPFQHSSWKRIERCGGQLHVIIW